MMVRAFSRLAALLGATLLPLPLWADVTPEDVWQNMQDMVSPMAVAVTAEATRSTDTLSLENVVYALSLPFEAGDVALSLGRLDLKDRGDGTVEMLYPSTAAYELIFTGPEGISQAASLGATYDGLEIIATGTPGDVTYDYEVARMDIVLADLVIPGVIASMSMEGFSEDYRGHFRTRAGDKVETTGSYSMGQQDFAFTQQMIEDGVTVDVEGKQGAASMTGDIQLVMPAEGMSLLNLAEALRAGLFAEIKGQAKGYFSGQRSSIDGQEIMSQSSLAEHYEMTMRFDQTGVHMAGPVENTRVAISLTEPIFLQTGIEIASGHGKLVLPLLKDDTFAPYQVEMEMTGIALDEEVWAMFDPGAALPRTPADLVIKASGHLKHMVEWLDVVNVEAAMADLTGLAIEPQDLTLESFLLSAAGAEVSGTGAVTFDNSGPVPMPVGTAAFEIGGVNALIDLLIEAGLITDQDATGARMGLAMMTVPAAGGGEDQLTTNVEMTAEGHVYVNGNRMK